MSSLLSMLTEQASFVSNKRPENPTSDQMTVSATEGVIKFSRAGIEYLGAGVGSRLGVVSMNGKQFGFAPTFPGGDKTVFLVRTSGKAGNRLGNPGGKFAFSGVSPWNTLGGTTENSKVFTFSPLMYGFYLNGTTFAAITKDTPADTAADQVVVFNAEGKLVEGTTVAAALAGQPFVSVTFVHDKAKAAAKGAGGVKKAVNPGSTIVAGDDLLEDDDDDSDLAGLGEDDDDDSI
jgi:hypothetical protein